MPVSVLGLAYFVVAVPLYSPVGVVEPLAAPAVARIAVAVSGMCFVLWLLTAELVIIHKICLWCTGVHVVTFLLFVLTLATAAGSAQPRRPLSLKVSAGVTLGRASRPASEDLSARRPGPRRRRGARPR